MNKGSFKINFKNEKVNFFGLAETAKKNKLNHKECLTQAFYQNVLIEDNKDFLKNFINSFDVIEKIYSQLYQDAFASFLIGGKFEKTFLEFGATDGLKLSNSYLLEKFFNWRGVLSEPSPQWHESLKKNRKNTEIITDCIWKESGKQLDFFMSDVGEASTLKDFVDSDLASMPENTKLRKKGGKTISVETMSLNDIVKNNFNGICPSYISIDTEGSEYEILKPFDLDKFRPKLFTIEHNHTENESKIDDLLIPKGYVRIFRELTAFDAWYIPAEILKVD